MKNKKGFTLIELLAVIVILAIIALIATPIVMNVIENSRKGAAERSAENYIDAVETAIATERLDGKILEGEYTIQGDGNLCPSAGCEVDGVNKKVTIDMSGNKPTGGTIFIENGQVVEKLSTNTTNPEKTTTIATKENYTVSYNEQGKLEATKGNAESTVMYTLEYIKNQTADNRIKYDPVANATCTSGNTCYNWYVLEDGDKTELTKGDFSSSHNETAALGTAGLNEVSLIIDGYMNNAVYSIWCLSSSNNSCNADGAKSYLNSLTSSWTVPTYLPTYAQIIAANGGSTKNLPDWLSGDIDPENSVLHGYWTSTAHSTKKSNAYVVHSSIGYDIVSGYGDGMDPYSVRPVITISKNQL